MSAVSFRSVFMVASCAGAALGCYLVSLRVASERAALEDVETKIVLAQRDIRVLQTEIGTRGRLAQLERWNVKVMALSAPTADQFLKGGFELARFTAPERKAPIEAPVVLASAPARDADSASSTQATQPGLMHEASLKTGAPRQKPQVSLEAPQSRPAPAAVDAQPAAKKGHTTTMAKPAESKVAAKSSPKAVLKAQTSSPGKAPAKPKVEAIAKRKPIEPAKAAKATARAPLAPLAAPRAKVASASKTTNKSARDLARKQ